MDSNVMAIVNTIVTIAVTLPLAIKRWQDIIWRNRRREAVYNDIYFADQERGDDEQSAILTTIGKKDTTRYSIDGEGSYGKGRLVLGVIKKYVATHRDSTYSKLKSVFPSKLRGFKKANDNTYWGCVCLKSEAEQLLEDTGRCRHFLKDDDIIKLVDGTEVVVSSQWGTSNIGLFINAAKELGFDIKTLA